MFVAVLCWGLYSVLLKKIDPRLLNTNGLFEFIGHNKLRVVSSSEKRPSSWSDGDYFEFDFRENNIP